MKIKKKGTHQMFIENTWKIKNSWSIYNFQVNLHRPDLKGDFLFLCFNSNNNYFLLHLISILFHLYF